MSESLRGSRLGYLSYETDAHVMPAERRTVSYVCPEGHTTVVPFSVEAEEIPYDWTCRCGRVATRPDMDAPEAKPERHQRTHWDMLLERRSIAELEDLLAERLDILHASDGRTLRRSA
jgi:hypothetical protein